MSDHEPAQGHTYWTFLNKRLMCDTQRAQRWHDTDHGAGPPSFSECWCCCTSCDPDYSTDRPNPFWKDAEE